MFGTRLPSRFDVPYLGLIAQRDESPAVWLDERGTITLICRDAEPGIRVGWTLQWEAWIVSALSRAAEGGPHFNPSLKLNWYCI